MPSNWRRFQCPLSTEGSRQRNYHFLENQGVPVERFSFPRPEVQCEFTWSSVSHETSSRELLRLILEPLELDLNNLQVPDRWGPSWPTIKPFLEPLSLSLWLLDPLVVQMRSSRVLYQDTNYLCVEKDSNAPDECILLIFRRCISASVGTVPIWHPANTARTPTHGQFVILGLLLRLTLFPLSPAKSCTGFSFSLASVTLSKWAWRNTSTNEPILFLWQVEDAARNSLVCLQLGNVKRNIWVPPLMIFPSQHF